MHHAQKPPAEIEHLGLRVQAFSLGAQDVQQCQEEAAGVGQDDDPFCRRRKGREPLRHHVRGQMAWLAKERWIEKGAERVLLVPRTHERGGGDYQRSKP